MIIPKSYKVRHTILQFLAAKRSKQQYDKFPIENAMFTIDEIAKSTGLDRNSIDQQLNVLWENKDVFTQPDDAHPKNISLAKYMALAKGVSTASAKTILNDGKIINSQLFNNYSSGVFQILTGIIALTTIILSFTTVSELKQQNIDLQKNIQLQQDRILILEGRFETLRNSSDTTTIH